MNVGKTKTKGKPRGAAGKSKKQSKAKRTPAKRPPPRASVKRGKKRTPKAQERMFSDEDTGVDPKLAEIHRELVSADDDWQAAGKRRKEHAEKMLQALIEKDLPHFKLDGVTVRRKVGAEKLGIERDKERSIEIDED